MSRLVRQLQGSRRLWREHLVHEEEVKAVASPYGIGMGLGVVGCVGYKTVFSEEKSRRVADP